MGRNESSWQSLINPIKEVQQAGSNVFLARVAHEKTHGPVTEHSRWHHCPEPQDAYKQLIRGLRVHAVQVAKPMKTYEKRTYKSIRTKLCPPERAERELS